jgi:hypothetical protein
MARRKRLACRLLGSAGHVQPSTMYGRLVVRPGSAAVRVSSERNVHGRWGSLDPSRFRVGGLQDVVDS